jgi:glycosyltransferase involved in cell wall biosynthesis
MGLLKTILDGFINTFDPAGSRERRATNSDPRPIAADGNDAAPYGVRIERAVVAPGRPFWRVVRVHHLTPEENGGNHHIFVDVLDAPLGGESAAPGQRLFNARVKVTWDGGESLVKIEKPLGEPGGNFPLWKSQVCSVQALGQEGDELPSDRVTGLHIRHPDEAPGNTWGHHSFYVTFVRAQPSTAGPAKRAISGRVLRGSGRTVVLRKEGVELTRQAVAGDSTYRFTGLSAGTYRVVVADTPIATAPLDLTAQDSVTADLALPAEGRPVAHYVLFGPAEEPATTVSLLLAQDFLLALRPAFGFSPAEAAAAGAVTIIADERSVSPEIAEKLTAGGAVVDRVSGPAHEVAAALARRIDRSSP